MPWPPFSPWILTIICLSSLCLNNCATSKVAREAQVPTAPEIQDVRPARLSDQPGPIRQLRIQELIIAQADLNRYPELAASDVREGLGQLLVHLLTETRRFDLMMPPRELAQLLSQTWESDPEGLHMRTRLKNVSPSAVFGLSAKLFDITACQPVSRLVSAQPQASCRSSVGVQVRIEAPSGQFVPGATHPLAPQARHIHAEDLPIFGTSEIAFGQSALGMAAEKAMQYALLQAIERLDRQGW